MKENILILVVTVGIHWASNSDYFMKYIKHDKTKAYLLSSLQVNIINLNLSLGYHYVHLLKTNKQNKTSNQLYLYRLVNE